MEKILEYQDAGPLLNDVETLRRQFDEDGFACFRGLLPATVVIEPRRLVLEIFRLPRLACARDGVNGRHSRRID